MVHLGVPGVSPISIYASPVNLSDVPTNASTPGGHPKDMGIEDKAKILSHFSDALDEMAQCISDLEDGYFLALQEVIQKTEKALHDISHIDSHYVRSPSPSWLVGKRWCKLPHLTWRPLTQPFTSRIMMACLCLRCTRAGNDQRPEVVLLRWALLVQG